MTEVINQVKTKFNVVDSSVSGNGEAIVVLVKNKHFSICPDGDSVTIYQCFGTVGNWSFLPGSKKGRSYKIVSNFIQSRAA